MTLSKVVSLASIAFGVLGTLALFRGSVAYEQGGFYDDDDFSITKAMNVRNRRRRLKQLIGPALIAVGFVLQVAQFAD